MPKRAFRPPLNAEHRNAIGAVVLCWTELEAAIEYLLWGLLQTNVKRASAVTTHLSTTARLDMLEVLATAHFGEGASEVAEVKELIKRVGDLRIERNNIVHGWWKGLGKFHKRTARKQWKVTEVKRTPVQMLHTAEQIRALEDDLYAFAFQHEELSLFPPVFGFAPTHTA